MSDLIAYKSNALIEASYKLTAGKLPAGLYQPLKIRRRFTLAG